MDGRRDAGRIGAVPEEAIMITRSSFALAAFACLLGAPMARGEEATPQAQVKALQGQLLQAILKGDTGFMEAHYTDDCLVIHGDGRTTTKAQELESFRSGATRYRSIAVREARIRIYGDAAVVNALATVDATINGQLYSGDVRNTRVWVRDGGTWKVVQFHATRVGTR